MTTSRIASDRIQVNLTPEHRQKLQDLARQRGKSASEVVRDLIEYHWGLSRSPSARGVRKTGT